MTKKQRESLIKDDIPQDSVVIPATANSQVQLESGDSVSAQTEQKNAEKPAQKMSKGEKIFDWITYKGLNYWVNLISSIAIADIFLNGKRRKNLDGWINSATKSLEKTGLPLKTSHHNSKVALETFVFTSGGLILLAPMKILEDNKRKVVHWINKKLCIEQKTADGKEKTPEQIYIEKEQPKQSWGNVIWRRIQATVAVIGSGMAFDHFARDKNKKLDPEVYDIGDGRKITYEAKVVGGKKRTEDAAYGLLNKVSKFIRGKEIKEKGLVGRWTRLIILDSVFTIITAVVMKITNGAKKAKMPEEIDETNDPPAIKNGYNKIKLADDARAVNAVNYAKKVTKKDNIPSLLEKGNKNSGFVESLHNQEVASAGVSV